MAVNRSGWLDGGVWVTFIGVCLLNGMFFTDTPGAWVLITIWLTLAAGAAGGWAYKAACSKGGLNLGPYGVRMWAVPASGPFIFAALYSFRLAAGPLSVQSTLDSLLRFLFYGIFGVSLCIAATRQKHSHRFLETLWNGIGGLLALSALAGVFGALPLPDAILRTGDKDIAATGARLGGLLQYPNTFGLVMSVFLLERLTSLARMSPVNFTRAGRWRGYRAAAFALLYAVCLLLAESRGVYASALVGWVLGACLLRGASLWRYALHSGIIALAGALLARQLSAARLAPAPLPGLLLLAAVMAAALALSGRAARRGGRRLPHACAAAGPRLAARCAIGGAALAAGGLALALLAAGGLLGRLLRPGTLSARAVMYGDALELFRRSPWFGSGGDVWRQAFRSIQSRPYVGNEVHSGYIDIALDLGLVGLAALLLWLGAIAVRMYKSRSGLLPSYAAIILHSMVDFDLSYSVVWLLILWLAAAAGIEGEKKTRGKENPVINQRRWTGLASSAIYACTSVLLLIAVLSGFRQTESLILYRLAAASGISEAQSMGLGGPAPAASDKTLRLLEQALEASPARTNVRISLAALSDPAQAVRLLRQGMAYDRNQSSLWLALGVGLTKQGDISALPSLQRAVALDRFDRGKQTAALRFILQLSGQLQEQGRLEQAQRAASTGAAMYTRYAELAKRIGETPSLRNDRGFAMTAEAAQIGGILITSSNRTSNLPLTYRYPSH